MFETVDSGQLINIRDIGNIQVKSAFEKFFALMRILPNGSFEISSAIVAQTRLLVSCLLCQVIISIYFAPGVAFRRTAFTPKLLRTFGGDLDVVDASARRAQKTARKAERAREKEARRARRKAEKMAKKEAEKAAAAKASRKVGPARPSVCQKCFFQIFFCWYTVS